jgi:hypothetical protein
MNDDDVLAEVPRWLLADEGHQLQSFRVSKGERDLQVTIHDYRPDVPHGRYAVEVREVADPSRHGPYTFGNNAHTIQHALAITQSQKFNV